MRNPSWLVSLGFLSVLFLFALGCHSRDDEDSAGIAGSNADAPADDPVGAAAAPLRLDGSYAVENTFDVLKGLTAVQDLVADLEDMGDGEHDPATWLIDKAMEDLDLPGMTLLLALLRPTLDDALNEVILALTPDILERLGSLTVDVSQTVKSFSMQSSLYISETDDTLSAYHSVQSIRARVEGQDTTLTLADLGFDEIQAGSIAVTLGEGNAIALAEHQLSVPLGAMLKALLERALIPALDPQAHDLKALLEKLLPCQDLAAGIEQIFPELTADQFVQICRIGIVVASKYLESTLTSIDEPGPTLRLQGAAQAIDADGDAQADRLTEGRWRTLLTLGKLHLVIPEDKNTFEATRE